jgi:hypothetical protein
MALLLNPLFSFILFLPLALSSLALSSLALFLIAHFSLILSLLFPLPTSFLPFLTRELALLALLAPAFQPFP